MDGKFNTMKGILRVHTLTLNKFRVHLKEYMIIKKTELER